MRYRVDLSYSGEGFCGWQIQPSAPSIQGAIQDALTMLLRTPVSLVGAGRTDTGVGALAYTAHFDAPAELDCAYLLRKLIGAVLLTAAAALLAVVVWSVLSSGAITAPTPYYW